MTTQQDTLSTAASEVAIREVVERLQSGFELKNGAVYASAFAPHHDYVIVNGTLFPNLTREVNASVHQKMFEGRQRGALGGDLSTMQVQCEIRNIRFLTPNIAVVQIVMKTGGNDSTIATAVMQQQSGEWLIVTFHNAHISAN